MFVYTITHIVHVAPFTFCSYNIYIDLLLHVHDIVCVHALYWTGNGLHTVN